MAHVLKFDDLMKIAALIGVSLRQVRVEDGADLYVIVDDDGNDLYVGQARTAKRHTDEDGWAENDHTMNVSVGFVALYRENNGQRRPLRHIPEEFDPSRVEAAIAGSGTGQAWNRDDPWLARLRAMLDAGEAPSLDVVETMLIRIHVRSGRLIGNSRGASQWETPVGSVADALAVLAVDAARVAGVIAAPPVAVASDPEVERIEDDVVAGMKAEGESR